MSDAPFGRCWHCGQTLKNAGEQLRLYKPITERMNVVVDEIAAMLPTKTVEERARWWALQDEFTELMRRSSLVVPALPAPAGAPSITCGTCKLTSYNPNDISERFCGRCHKWHAVPDDYALQGGGA
jgi:hypothetical protein